MPGPPPKPTALKQLQGNPGKRPLNEREPQPERTTPAMPRGMPAKAQKFWKAYAPELDRLGLLNGIDGPAFAMLAIHYEIAWQASQVLKEDGLQTDDENGALRKHPILQVLRDNSQMFLRYAMQFGMTPSARSRIEVPEPGEKQDIATVLAEIMKSL